MAIISTILRRARVLDLKICKRCGGSGWLFRPNKIKMINFKKCTDCNGRGTRHKIITNR